MKHTRTSERSPNSEHLSLERKDDYYNPHFSLSEFYFPHMKKLFYSFVFSLILLFIVITEE